MDELEAETARIHKEILSDRSEHDRQKEKRTVSDNTRPVSDQ
jgi:hypothetical protein